MNSERSVTGGLFLLAGIVFTILIILLALIGVFPAHAQTAQDWEDWGFCRTLTVVTRVRGYNVYTIVADCEDWLIDDNNSSGTVNMRRDNNLYTLRGCLPGALCNEGDTVIPAGKYLTYLPAIRYHANCIVSTGKYANGNLKIQITCQSQQTVDAWFNFLWEARFFEDGSYILKGELPDL